MSILEKNWVLSSELMMTVLSVRRYGISRTRMSGSAATGTVETLNQYTHEMYNSFEQKNIS